MLRTPKTPKFSQSWSLRKVTEASVSVYKSTVCYIILATSSLNVQILFLKYVTTDKGWSSSPRVTMPKGPNTSCLPTHFFGKELKIILKKIDKYT